MPQADQWTPEDGDGEWWPDPERPVDSYTDQELRFLPVYRQVRSMVSGDLSDAETLGFCREMIRAYVEGDECN
jgi:hypothetical protein